MDNIEANPTGGVFPNFFMRLVLDHAETNKQGRDVHKEVEWVELFIVGDKYTKPSRKVSEEDKMRWPDKYKAFIEGREMPLKGTAIDQWNTISRSRAADLKSMHIRTVEDLAALDDSAIQRIGMGAREMVAKAKSFISSQSDNEALAAQNAELLKRIEDLEKKAKKKPAKKKTKAA